jgi:hypothetical protein
MTIRPIPSTLAVALVALCACSSEPTKKPSPPSPGDYSIAFPSEAAAVGAKTVQVLVFDASIEGNDCQSLVFKRRNGQDLPAALVQSQPVAPCDLTTGTNGALNVSYGKRAFFVITQYNGPTGTGALSDYLLGCASGDVYEGGPKIPVSLTPADVRVGVPATTCETLAQKCAGGC